MVSIAPKRVIIKKDPGTAKRHKGNNEGKIYAKLIYGINFMYDENLIKLANKLGRQIHSDEVDKFLESPFMAKVEQSVERVKPTYLGFLYNHFAMKIGETMDPDIMQRTAVGRKMFFELVLCYTKR